MINKILKTFLTSLLVLSIVPLSLKADTSEIDLSSYSEEDSTLIQYMIDTNPDFDINEGEVVAIKQVTVPISINQNARGTIGADFMTMTISIQRIGTNGSEFDDFKFQVKADWLNAPFFRMRDAIAIAWSDDFTQYSHNCKAYYNSQGYISNKTSLLKSTPEKGVAYNVESSDWATSTLDYVVLTVYVHKYDSQGTAAVEATYAHATASFGIGFSVSFTGTPSISFSTAGAADYLVMDDDFYY